MWENNRLAPRINKNFAGETLPYSERFIQLTFTIFQVHFNPSPGFANCNETSAIYCFPPPAIVHFEFRRGGFQGGTIMLFLGHENCITAARLQSTTFMFAFIINIAVGGAAGVCSRLLLITSPIWKLFGNTTLASIENILCFRVITLTVTEIR